MQDMEKIYEQYFNIVNKYLFCLTHNYSISEELTQETFYRAVKKIDTYKGECKISVWLCQIAKNLWYDQFRKSRIVNGCMAGLKPAVIGMLAASLFSLVQTVLVPETGFTWNSPIFYISVLILFIMGILSFRKMHPIIIIFLSAFMGIGMGYLTEIL